MTKEWIKLLSGIEFFKIVFLVFSLLSPGFFYILIFRPEWILFDTIKLVFLSGVLSTPVVFVATVSSILIGTRIDQKKKPKMSKKDAYDLVIVTSLSETLHTFTRIILLSYGVFYLFRIFSTYMISQEIIYWSLLSIQYIAVYFTFLYRTIKSNMKGDGS